MEEQTADLEGRSEAGQEAMIWVAMSCNRCVPVDKVQHAEVMMAMQSAQLRKFWLCSDWTRVVAAGSEQEFRRWFSFTETVSLLTEKHRVLAAEIEAKVLGLKPRPGQDEVSDEQMWHKAGNMLELVSCNDSHDELSWAQQCWSAAGLLKGWLTFWSPCGRCDEVAEGPQSGSGPPLAVVLRRGR